MAGRRGMTALRRTVYMASSGGGHSELLSQLLESVQQFERVWVTQRSRRADSLEARAERVEYLPEWDRRAYVRGRIVSNLVRSFRLALRRPDVVVTTGAGLVVPFCLLAKVLGSKLLFIETPARLRRPSKSGRILGRVADSVIVQWAPLLDVYPNALLCVPPLLEVTGTRAAKPKGGGTVVAVGTHQQGFERLLAMVDQAVEEGVLPGPVTAQGGVSSYVPRNYAVERFLEAEVMEQAIGGAECVICHGGSGIITAALVAGHRPMVLPRLRMHREHVDDHQLDMLEELVKMDLAVSLQEGLTPAALKDADRPLPDRPMSESPLLRDAVRDEVARLADQLAA